MPLWHPQLWQNLQMHTCVERKIPVILGSTRDTLEASHVQCQPGGGSSERHNLPFRPALVVLWHLDGRSFLKHFLESLFCSSVREVVDN